MKILSLILGVLYAKLCRAKYIILHKLKGGEWLLEFHTYNLYVYMFSIPHKRIVLLAHADWLARR